MAMKFEELIQAIETVAPSYTQESWDNSGVQIACSDAEIYKVLTSLEMTEEIIDEACDNNVDVIITHHPLIFGGIKKIDYRDMTGSYIVKLLNAGISVYSSHTPFDKVEGGNNDYLADLIGLKDISGFTVGDDVDMIGRVGMLEEPMPLAAMVDLLSEVLDIDPEQIRSVGAPDKSLTTVGICTGAGADLMGLAIENGCDVLITGDVKYHEAQEAKARGIALIDAGHYGTEKTFAHNFAEKLRQAVGRKVEILESKVDIDPFDVL